MSDTGLKSEEIAERLREDAKLWRACGWTISDRMTPEEAEGIAALIEYQQKEIETLDALLCEARYILSNNALKGDTSASQLANRITEFRRSILSGGSK